LAETKQRFSGLGYIRQCGEDVLRMFVTGGPPVCGGGGMPRHHLGPLPCVADHRSWIARKHAEHRRQVTDKRLMTRNSAMITA